MSVSAFDRPRSPPSVSPPPVETMPKLNILEVDEDGGFDLDNVEVVKAMSSSLESLIQGEIMQVPALQSIGAAVVVDGVSGVGRVTLLSYAFPFVSSGNGLLPSYQIFAAFLAVSEAETKTFRRFRR